MIIIALPILLPLAIMIVQLTVKSKSHAIGLA